MAVSLPRLLRRVRPDLAHFKHALPLGFHGRSVVTLHDLSFEADDTAMGLLDRLTFRTVVPRAARRADRVIAVSERTKRDIVVRYGIAESKVTVTPNGVDPVFAPGGDHAGYVLFVGAIQARKSPLAALEAAPSTPARRRPREGRRSRPRAARRRRRPARLRDEEELADLIVGCGARPALASRLRAARPRGNGERHAS
jgi:glycosyltransferase involved in cell wall biosynthesis